MEAMILSCPNRDGFLKTYTTSGKNGLPVTYHRCPHCRGFWMSAFAANFLTDSDIESAHYHPGDIRFTQHHSDGAGFTPLCPECKAHLLLSHADNIPAGISAFHCPVGHGYFFPAGELTKFKTAQQAKIAYHKLWNIPLPSVASVLLAGVVVILLSGIIATTIAIRQQQTNVSQARQLLVSHSTLPTAGGTVFFVATTSVSATVTLHIPAVTIVDVRMETQDRLIHTANVPNLAPATYQYFFTIEHNGKTVQTEMFAFTQHHPLNTPMPRP